MSEKNKIWVVERYDDGLVGVKPKWVTASLFPSYEVDAFVTKKDAREDIGGDPMYKYRIVKFVREAR